MYMNVCSNLISNTILVCSLFFSFFLSCSFFSLSSLLFSSLATTARNKDSFLVLHNAFLHSCSSHLGKDIIDAIINIYKCDPANFFLLEPLHTLSSFLEALENKNEDVQVCIRTIKPCIHVRYSRHLLIKDTSF